MSVVSRAPWSPELIAKLREAMDWVIPPDTSPGAGTEVGARLVMDLVDEQGGALRRDFDTALPSLRFEDLTDNQNAFAQVFIDVVRDVYYGHAETGSWADIGFFERGE